MEDFQIKNQEIEDLLKKLANFIKDLMPKGWGFSLLIFSLGEGGSMFYISDSRREDMIKAMKEFIAKNE